MFIFLPLIIFAVGLLIGSFLNVVILRLNTGRSAVTGRSACARCDRALTWYELIPVASFVGLRGTCRTCKTRISFQYPIVELLTAIIFVALYSQILIPLLYSSIAWLSFIFAAVIACVLIVILVYDIRHQIIPDIAVYTFIILALISIFYRAFTVPGFEVLSALFGGAVVGLIFFVLWYFSKGRAMGFGDVKLGLGMGWLLGLWSGLTAVVVSFWIGGIVGLCMIALSSRYTMKTRVPFAPFMIAAIGVVVLWGVHFSSLFPLW